MIINPLSLLVRPLSYAWRNSPFLRSHTCGLMKDSLLVVHRVDTHPGRHNKSPAIQGKGNFIRGVKLS